MGDIPWTDNRGNNGTIDRLYSYANHLQEYYPEWLPDGLTFRGTRLPDNMLDLSVNVDKDYSKWYYVLVGFRYGYADNLYNWKDKSDANTWDYDACGFDIGWAVDENRQPVDLDFIDFVRVYTGLNQKCPAPDWWGETSTEIQSAEDIHLDASLEAIRTALSGIRPVTNLTKCQTPCEVYDLRGVRRRDSGERRSEILIKNGKKFFLK